MLNTDLYMTHCHLWRFNINWSTSFCYGSFWFRRRPLKARTPIGSWLSPWRFNLDVAPTVLSLTFSKKPPNALSTDLCMAHCYFLKIYRLEYLPLARPIDICKNCRKLEHRFMSVSSPICKKYWGIEHRFVHGSLLFR